jgi:hypothetical protein
MRVVPPSFFLLISALSSSPALAQHGGHQPPPSPSPSPSPPPSPPQHDMAAMQHGEAMHEMHGLFGPYPMSREASGTSWQPEATPMEGIHWMRGAWMGMVHGFIDLVFDHQGGPRGDDKLFAPNMAMVMAQRPAGGGTFAIRGMVSAEPATIGKRGYPLLLQTGETADGRTPLIDRQHPHDAAMELALSYSHKVDDKSSVFIYAGLPGEPALGPPTFMHRFSGMSLPESPIGHHWLDSTHITFGVLTGGVVWSRVKAEASAFNGREPDERRWNIESPRFNSYSARLTWNPSLSWSLQGSYGHLNEPEQLEPGVDIDRTTISGSYHRARDSSHWQTTLTWGRNAKDPGAATNVFLLESAYRFGRHRVFGRGEAAQKDELFDSGPFAHRVFDVGKVSAGYVHDFPRLGHLVLGAGGLGSVYFVPSDLKTSYGSRNPTGFMLFVRAELRPSTPSPAP